MTPADVEATVRRLLDVVFFLPEDLDASTRLADYLDGEDYIDVIAVFEGEFHVTIDDLPALPTVGALIADLQQRVAALGAAQEPQQ